MKKRKSKYFLLWLVILSLVILVTMVSAADTCKNQLVNSEFDDGEDSWTLSSLMEVVEKDGYTYLSVDAVGGSSSGFQIVDVPEGTSLVKGSAYVKVEEGVDFVLTLTGKLDSGSTISTEGYSFKLSESENPESFLEGDTVELILDLAGYYESYGEENQVTELKFDILVVKAEDLESGVVYFDDFELNFDCCETNDECTERNQICYDSACIPETCEDNADAVDECKSLVQQMVDLGVSLDAGTCKSTEIALSECININGCHAYDCFRDDQCDGAKKCVQGFCRAGLNSPKFGAAEVEESSIWSFLAFWK